MHRFLISTLLVVSLAGCQKAPAPAEAAAPPPPAPRKIELHDATDRPVSLEAGGSAASSAAPGSSAASLQPTAAQQAALLAPLTRKSRPYEGAVVEQLGPCNGRGVAGEITVNGEKKPICGAEQPSYVGYDGLYFGQSPYQRSTRSPYGGSYYRGYPSRP